MTTRRSFFRRCAGLIAAVVLAQEIAFSRRLTLPSVIGWDEPSGRMSAVEQTQFVRWFFFGKPLPHLNVYDRVMEGELHFP
jgi:hypothetical protein